MIGVKNYSDPYYVLTLKTDSGEVEKCVHIDSREKLEEMYNEMKRRIK